MIKYKLTNNTINLTFNRTLYQIVAKRSISKWFIKKSDLGGFIEKKENLSHDGSCWIAKNARVYGNARVCDNAQIYGNAQVYGDAQVYGNACVGDDTQVYGNAQVYGDAHVYGNAILRGNIKVCDNAQVYGNAILQNTEDVKFVARTNLSKNVKASIAAQTGIRVSDSGVFYAYKHVKNDLTSLHDSNFKYYLNKRIVVKNPDLSNRACADGIHVSTADYWNDNKGEKIILCKCCIDDVITVQMGKIRMRAVTPIEIISECVY